MTFVPGSSLLPRMLRRPAMVFFALAQVLLALAPLVEMRGGSSEAHFEEAGTSIHHSHDEANCAACAARVLLASSLLPDKPDLIGLASTLQLPADSRPLVLSRVSGALHSRAPPLNLA